jgi:hypothetical protein
MKTVEVFGETFGLNDSNSFFALLEFADADVEDGRETMKAQFRLLKDCIIADDWARFRAAATKHRATSEDLEVVFTAMSEAVTDRPTGLPADSSVGQPVTAPSSDAKPDGKVSEMFPGRPDKAFAVMQTIAG